MINVLRRLKRKNLNHIIEYNNFYLSRSNKHGRKRPYMEKYDDVREKTASYWPHTRGPYTESVTVELGFLQTVSIGGQQQVVADEDDDLSSSSSSSSSPTVLLISNKSKKKNIFLFSFICK